VVRGAYTNIKITTPEDLTVARSLLKTMGTLLTGQNKRGRRTR